MHLTLRLPLLRGLLLLACTPVALAESPLPDPVAPAVIGRPLEQARPARPVRAKPAAAKPMQPRPAAATGVVRQPAALATGVAQGAAGTRPAKQAVDDRADPRMRAAEVGKGTRFARKPLAPGAYIGEKHRAAVRKYYAEHPVSGKPANWRIGEPVPRGAAPAAVPKAVLASLPAVPPGHRYVQLGGEVLLIAAGSRMVVDGISR